MGKPKRVVAYSRLLWYEGDPPETGAYLGATDCRPFDEDFDFFVFYYSTTAKKRPYVPSRRRVDYWARLPEIEPRSGDSS